MKKTTKNNRTLIIFYFLISYVILQFLWWGFHIISLTQKVNDYEGQMSRRIGMVIGEASVFIIIIVIGAYYVIRSYYKEMELAKKQEADAAKRNSMVSSGDRSAKIRTYNYSQGRVTDHRINLTLYDLSNIINGDIQKILDELRFVENTEKLKENSDIF